MWPSPEPLPNHPSTHHRRTTVPPWRPQGLLLLSKPREEPSLTSSLILLPHHLHPLNQELIQHAMISRSLSRPPPTPPDTGCLPFPLPFVLAMQTLELLVRESAPSHNKQHELFITLKTSLLLFLFPPETIPRDSAQRTQRGWHGRRPGASSGPARPASRWRRGR